MGILRQHVDVIVIGLTSFVLFCLLFLLFTMLFISVPAHSAKPAGAPESSFEERKWFQQATIPGIGGCCSEADGFREGITYPEEDGLSVGMQGVTGHPHPGGVILSEWKTSEISGEYEIKVLGQWMHADKQHVLPPKPPNPTGGAVAFLVFNYSTGTGDHGQYKVFLRCFAPGNQF